jgi:uncharacterized membrane protein YkoI
LLRSSGLRSRLKKGEGGNRTREGAVHSLRSIENDIVPEMKARGADYIGAEFDEENLYYRLKFMKGSKVIWLDVNGRNGAIIRKTGD